MVGAPDTEAGALTELKSEKNNEKIRINVLLPQR